jgi:ribose/xylose/arabinose/galactoside ABC-type transport system permease subunit
MDRMDVRAALLGGTAGAIAGIAQPAVGKLEEAIFPRGEDTNIPRHFIDALIRKTDVEMSGPARWLAGAAFHIGYALFWGAAYGVVCRRHRLPPLVGGLGLSSTLYLMAFSRIGGATLAGSESPPWRRPARTWLLTTTMPLTYGMTTAWAYEKLQRR